MFYFFFAFLKKIENTIIIHYLLLPNTYHLKNWHFGIHLWQNCNLTNLGHYHLTTYHRYEPRRKILNFLKISKNNKNYFKIIRTWSHSSKSLKKNVVSATSKIIPSIVWAKSSKTLGSFPYFAAKEPVSKVWNRIKVSSKSQIKTRSTWDSSSGLWLFLRLAFRLGFWLRAEKKNNKDSI